VPFQPMIVLAVELGRQAMIPLAVVHLAFGL
jgi:hypothetical protein